MIYTHQYFQLDTEANKTFDENGKELLLTGNAYRMLVFLCANKNATLTQIGESLDWAKEYTENHLRQYRYKINTIVGQSVIEYQNNTYSLIGDVQEGLELAKNYRNTDLLQSEDIILRQDNKVLSRNMKFIKKFGIVVAVLLIVIIPVYLFNKNPTIKKSNTGICHEKGTDYYAKTKNFTPYSSLSDCLDSGGRVPKK